MAGTGKPFARPWLFTAIFLAVGLGLLSGGIYSFLSTRTFIGDAVSARGVVIDLEEHWDSGDNSYTYYPRVRFQTENGDAHRFTGDVGSSPPAFDVGEAVQVLFDPSDPSAARIDSFMQLWFTSLILGGMGVVFSIVGGGSLFAFGHDEKHRTAQAAQSAPGLIAPATEPAPAMSRDKLPAKRGTNVVDRGRRD
jgi:hypothetical protein